MDKPRGAVIEYPRKQAENEVKFMRLGGGIMKPWKTPAEYMELVKELGYGAVVFPVDCSAPKELIRELKNRLDDAGITIGEVGVWRNLMAADHEERKAHLDFSVGQLALAEEVGARCCVNISGAAGEVWDGCYPGNYSEETRNTVIEQTRYIIDAVKPRHTSYSLEPMPWMLPDSPDDYLSLIREVDRKEFGVHLDFCNMISSPARYLKAEAFIRECFEKLSPYIRSIHIKDCAVDQHALPFSVLEKRVGEGTLPLYLVLKLANELDSDMPLFTEHLERHEDYAYSAGYLQALARDHGLRFK